MKKVLMFLVFSLLFMGSLSAKNVLAYVPVYDSEGKIIPMVENGFEYVQGTYPFDKIDTVVFHDSAIGALIKRGYKVINDEEGCLTYMLKKNSYHIIMKLKYNEKEYWFEYVDSSNLNANPFKNKIHKSYYRWIKNLDNTIISNYGESI